MKHVIGVAEAKVANRPGDVLVTHGLGSCLGITAHDALAGVGGILHAMLPLAETNPEKARANPYIYVDAGLQAFLESLQAAGAHRARLQWTVAGGAQLTSHGEDHFAIGRRNYVVLTRVFWKSGLMLAAEDVGGSCARTMYLEVGSGRVWLQIAGETKALRA